MARVRDEVNIGNHTSVAEMLQICEEKGVNPADAEVVVETFMENNSNGSETWTSEVLLRFNTKP